jgi:hypothetical protein
MYCRRSVMFPALLIFAGSWLLLDRLGVLPPLLTSHIMWPVLMIALGVSLIWSRSATHSSPERATRDDRRP